MIYQIVVCFVLAMASTLVSAQPVGDAKTEAEMMQYIANAPWPARYPWDRRKKQCFLGGELASGPWCDKEVADWPDHRWATENLNQLMVKPDFAVIALAEQDVAFSSERMQDGLYRAEIWNYFFSKYMEYTADRHEIAAAWFSATGSEGMGCFAVATAFHADAMRARGGGLAKTVTATGWEYMAEKLVESDKVLDSCHKKVKATLPWHVLRLTNTYLRTQDRKQREVAFGKAVAAWPDSIGVYAIAMTFAMPVWGGSYREMEAIAQKALANTRKATKTTAYSHLYASAFEAGQMTLSFAEAEADWELMKQSFRDHEAYGRHAYMQLRQFPSLACAKEDREEARRLFEQLNQYPNELRLERELLESSNPCRRFAYDL